MLTKYALEIYELPHVCNLKPPILYELCKCEEEVDLMARTCFLATNKRHIIVTSVHIM